MVPTFRALKQTLKYYRAWRDEYDHMIVNDERSDLGKQQLFHPDNSTRR
jgi:hypothetical protein